MGAAAYIGNILDLVKKWLEISKLRREAKADQKAEEDDKRLVRLATAEEITEYGISSTSRKVIERIRLQRRKDRVDAKPFVSHESEEKF